MISGEADLMVGRVRLELISYIMLDVVDHIVLSRTRNKDDSTLNNRSTSIDERDIFC